jgi:class 3 adenylate cyclase/tetratricopeptide (TPR) repeat protein
MESPIAYIPMDRRQALARGESLPERCDGAALFADISGFTPLTEALVLALGPQRGAEELPRQLNLVYGALVGEVDRYGGAVLGFSGDAITCWFDDRSPADAPPGAVRAAACALALQAAMAPFAELAIPGVGAVSLTIKVGVAGGPARRMLVGDPAIALIDVLAGATIQRMAAAEHQAGKGEVVVDEAAAAALGERGVVAGWRADEERGARFAVLAGLAAPVPPAPWPPLADDAIPEERWRPWLLPPVYERLRAGMGAFLTELRPVTALFTRFAGIDYDGDPLAREKLDAFVLWAQRILRAYDSSILQLTVGDKGSYFYAAFGAPIAHEDDQVRALMAALELREPRFPFIESVQVGLSVGRCRTGAYGGPTRRTYGALGDEVNLAARLMQAAPPGQALASEPLRRATGDRFTWESLPARLLKGKRLPVAPQRLIGVDRAAVRLHEPRYALPMVGRQAELGFILDQLRLAAAGSGQIVGIAAEAGMGKSRLVAEVVQRAWARNLRVYGGECQSFGVNTPYLAWQSVWRGLFGLDPAAPPEEQAGALRLALARLDPALLSRLPLLGPALGLSLPDNELTASLDARLRKAALESLLVRCLAVRAAEAPVVLVLEDCHWLDPLSHDLLEAIGRAAATLPVLVLLAYRPPQVQRLLDLRVRQLGHFRELALDSLLPDEVRELVRLKLAQVVGSLDELPEALVERLNERAQGNPFYVEELLSYMRDQGLDARRPDDLARLELPPSLQSLILSRIDRLTESQQSLIKVASVIGRLFRASILWGVASFFGQQARVRRELEELSALELTPLDTPDPELTYLFKHIVTQEVTYESITYATRAVIHEQIAQQLEQAAEGRELPVDLLAFHYDRSENLPRRREYLLRAGAAAQAIYANVAAIDYYRRALPLLDGAERADALLRLGQVREFVGRWPEAEQAYREALAAAGENPAGQGRAQAALGELLRKQGRFADAGAWLDQARARFEAAGDRAGVALTYHTAGTLASQQGDGAAARALYEASLALRRELGDEVQIASLLSNLGIVARAGGDLQQARAFQEQALAARRALGHRWGVATSLNNLGNLLLDLGLPAEARERLEEAVALFREIGDRSVAAIAINTLANSCRAVGDYAAAARLYRESLALSRELGDRWAAAHALEDIGGLAAQVEQPALALRLVAAAGALRAGINAPLAPAERARLDALLAPARAALSPAERAAAEAQGGGLPAERAIDEALGLTL